MSSRIFFGMPYDTTIVLKVKYRGECAVTGSCPFTQVGSSSDVFTDTGTYTVDTDGDFVLTLLEQGEMVPFTLTGTVSADGKTAIFNQIADNETFGSASESFRTLGIAFKQ